MEQEKRQPIGARFYLNATRKREKEKEETGREKEKGKIKKPNPNPRSRNAPSPQWTLPLRRRADARQNCKANSKL